MLRPRRSGGVGVARALDKLIELLDLEAVGEDVFRGQNEGPRQLRLFLPRP